MQDQLEGEDECFLYSLFPEGREREHSTWLGKCPQMCGVWGDDGRHLSFNMMLYSSILGHTKVRYNGDSSPRVL